MRNIAIILSRDVLTDSQDYHDTYSKIVDSITDWTEVTEEEYQLLHRAQSYDYHHRFTLVERPTNEREYVSNTVASYLAWAKKQEQKRKAQEDKRKALALERKEKREAKTRAQKLKLLEQLKSEFPDKG